MLPSETPELWAIWKAASEPYAPDIRGVLLFERSKTFVGSGVPSRWVTWVMGSRVADADREKGKGDVYTDFLQHGLHVDLDNDVR